MTGKPKHRAAKNARRLASQGHAKWAAIPFIVYPFFAVSVVGTASLYATDLYDIAAVDLRRPAQPGIPITDAVAPYGIPAFSSCIYPCTFNPLDELRTGFYHHGDTRGHFTLRGSRGLFTPGRPGCQGPGCVFYRLDARALRGHGDPSG